MWAAASCIAAALPAMAAAHSGGSTELLAQLVVHPTDPNIMVARYEAGSAGLLYSDDGGRSFRMSCAAAIGDGADRGTHVGMGGDGKVLIATFNGVSVDDGAGCGWTAEPSLEGLWVRQLVRHPTDPDTLFAVTGTGVEGTLNALAMRGPDAAWSDLGAREPLLITGLAVATLPAGGLRLYESVEGEVVDLMVDGELIARRRCEIRVSDDLGESWQSTPCPVSAGKVRVEAVDPGNAERPVVSEHDETGVDRVWVSDDRAQTFRPWAELSDFGALAFDGDGRVWLGDWGDAGSPVPSRGLLTAANLDEAPAVIADYPVHCLAYAPSTDTLYGCQRFWIGTIDTETGAFETTFTLDDTLGFVECAEDAANACEETLCQAFCGPGSFPVAPVCETYDGPSCGQCAIADPALRPQRCSPVVDPSDAGPQEDASKAMAGGCSCSAARGHLPPTKGTGVLLACLLTLAICRSVRRGGSERA